MEVCDHEGQYKIYPINKLAAPIEALAFRPGRDLCTPGLLHVHRPGASADIGTFPKSNLDNRFSVRTAS